LRGDVLIFNHFKYSPNLTNEKLSQRDGTQKDVEELQEIFSGLGLRVAIHTDLTRQEIINTLVNRKFFFILVRIMFALFSITGKT
jgi:hypothetical protein